MGAFSRHLVFVDESGDHGLERVSDDYPVFVLLFAVFKRDDYINQVCRDVQRLKHEFWGHDETVLHEHDIRKPSGHFQILMQKTIRDAFQERLSALMEVLPVTVIAVVIDKPRFLKRYATPMSPYHYALEAGLERVYRHLEDVNDATEETPVIVECRGKAEDTELELVFRRVCSGENALQKALPLKHVMIPKASNSVGLQLADLMARPVGIHHFRPTQTNRAYEIIQKKFRRSMAGRVEGYGLKVLP